jgi:hypothetical protein
MYLIVELVVVVEIFIISLGTIRQMQNMLTETGYLIKHFKHLANPDHIQVITLPIEPKCKIHHLSSSFSFA